MKIYPENYSVSFTVGFTDLNGDAVVPSEVRAALYDGDDALLVDFGTLPFDPALTSKEIIIPGAFNALGATELEASRILRVELVMPAGVIRRALSYIVSGESRLALMVNSFLTMEAAELLERSMPNLQGWAAAAEDQRFAALIEAFNRLTRIPMKFRDASDNRQMTAREESLYRRENVILRTDWPDLTENDFLALPTDFRKALRAAQMLEANEILEGDAVARRHRAGIISETVGESSMMLRGGNLDYGLSALSLSALTGYIYFNCRVVRS